MAEQRCTLCGEPTDGTVRVRVSDVNIRLCAKCTEKAAKKIVAPFKRKWPLLFKQIKQIRSLAARNKP